MLSNLTPVVKNLILINVIAWLGIMVFEYKFPGVYNYLILYKVDWLGFRQNLPHYDLFLQKFNRFMPHQLVTYFFMHSNRSFFHIVLNMLTFASLGPLVERVMGSKRFLALYLFSGLLGGLLTILFDTSVVPIVGASGAISGVLVAFAYYFPDLKLMIFLIPIQFTARKLVIGFAVISAVLILWNPGAGGLSHFGHLAGMASGLVYLWIDPRIRHMF